MPSSGRKVGAIADARDGVVGFLGYGTLSEEQVPPGSATGLPCPTIKLSTGELLWGCECWWHDVEAVEAYLAQASEVVQVDVVQNRLRSRPKIGRVVDPPKALQNRNVPYTVDSSVILIGPIRAGKSTIARRLSLETSWPVVSMDEKRWDYFREAGWDQETSRGLAGYGHTRQWHYDLRYYAYSIDRILEDYGRHHIIDLGGRHTLFEDDKRLQHVRESLEPFPRVVLVLPTHDLDASLRILDERRGMRHLLYGFDANALMLTHPSNYVLASQIHYNHDKTPSESCLELRSTLALA